MKTSEIQKINERKALKIALTAQVKSIQFLIDVDIVDYIERIKKLKI